MLRSGDDLGSASGRISNLEGQDWRTPETEALLSAVVRLEAVDEAARFFRDLCTLGELHALANRWAVVRLLDEGLHYAEIAARTGASTATITRIAQWLRHGEGGYRLMLQRTRGGPAGSTYPDGREH